MANATGDPLRQDRAFRPDIEGLRAVAVVCVVLFHYFRTQVAHLNGGYVGVDVFFVISGYVITCLFLRERLTTGKTSYLTFYGRRARRILPMATLVIVASLIGERFFVSLNIGRLVADDARWAAVFLANVHFARVYPNYLAPRPGSALQTYWSLAVEEQFYLVFPTLFVAVATFARRHSVRWKLAFVLLLVIAASFTWSVVSTTHGTLTAYDSTFTRAWELALGALIATAGNRLARVPAALGAIATWIGLVGIGLAVYHYNLFTNYPGWESSLPVVSTALVIAGGCSAPRWGAEAILRTTPFKWLGRWSYSLYLWHWPLLVVATQHWKQISTTTDFVLVGLSVILAAVSYFAVENPIRRSRWLSRSRWGNVASLGLGAGLIGVIFIAAGLVA
jgi:peptidoglycan/LPS O-acetylase OafA/YrhL